MLTCILALAVAVGAAAQLVSGIGFVLVCGPALVATLGPHQGVRLAVALSLALNIGVLAATRRTPPNFRRVLLLLVPAALATPPLAAAATALPAAPAAAAAGAVTLLAAIALGRGLRLPRLANPAGAVLAGVVSAAMNVLAAIGGPAVALYAANAGWPVRETRSTFQAYFLALNLVALPTLGLPHVSSVRLLAAGGGLAAGLLLGRPLTHRIPEERARVVVLVLAGAGGAAVLVRSLVGLLA